ncbi:hypothetical protein [Paenibacillus sp. 481]|uniref:hypothetical protein n=1 Tax=Paenibacillus sp. 481 TaxID=2835869 RepID=UPI001E5B536D|nr:hypothetical protein [Paenibacillus sp. 481]UHA73755.1 hypothetical protein KIK04_00855 [Paenibacillus sp. 481]
MNHLIEKLEQLYAKEAVLDERLSTCLAYQTAILDFTIQEGYRSHRTVIEDIMFAVHRVEMDLRMESCRLKLEKVLLSSEIRSTEGATT